MNKSRILRRVGSLFLSGLTLLGLMTLASCGPETNTPVSIPAQACPVPIENISTEIPQAPAPPGFFALEFEVHYYDNNHATDDPTAIGDEVLGTKDMTVTLNGVGPNGQADVTFINPISGQPQKAPVTYGICPPYKSEQVIQEGMVGVTWTVSTDVLTQGYTMECLVRVLPSLIPIHTARLDAPDGKKLVPSLTCVWP